MAKAAVAVGIMAITAAAQMYSQYQAGKQNAGIHKYNAAVASNAAALEAGRIKEEGLRRFSAIQADAGASGFTQEGSVLETLFAQARETERESQIALYNGQVQSTASYAQATKAKGDAKRAMFETAASTARQGMSMMSMGGGG